MSGGGKYSEKRVWHATGKKRRKACLIPGSVGEWKDLPGREKTLMLKKPCKVNALTEPRGAEGEGGIDGVRY